MLQSCALYNDGLAPLVPLYVACGLWLVACGWLCVCRVCVPMCVWVGVWPVSLHVSQMLRMCARMFRKSQLIPIACGVYQCMRTRGAGQGRRPCLCDFKGYVWARIVLSTIELTCVADCLLRLGSPVGSIRCLVRRLLLPWCYEVLPRSMMYTSRLSIGFAVSSGDCRQGLAGPVVALVSVCCTVTLCVTRVLRQVAAGCGSEMQ